MSSKKFLFGQAVITELHDKLREQGEPSVFVLYAARANPRIFYPLIYKRRSLAVFFTSPRTFFVLPLPPWRWDIYLLSKRGASLEFAFARYK